MEILSVRGCPYEDHERNCLVYTYERLVFLSVWHMVPDYATCTGLELKNLSVHQYRYPV